MGGQEDGKRLYEAKTSFGGQMNKYKPKASQRERHKRKTKIGRNLFRDADLQRWNKVKDPFTQKIIPPIRPTTNGASNESHRMDLTSV